MDNVIGFPTRASEPTVIEFEIALDTVDEARRTLECLEATVAIGLKLCEKSETGGDELTLAAIGRVFAAYHALILRERGIVPDGPGCVLPRSDGKITPLCSLPRFPRDDPPDPGAA
jgi:hypothetical protein